MSTSTTPERPPYWCTINGVELSASTAQEMIRKLRNMGIPARSGDDGIVHVAGPGWWSPGPLATVPLRGTVSACPRSA